MSSHQVKIKCKFDWIEIKREKVVNIQRPYYYSEIKPKNGKLLGYIPVKEYQFLPLKILSTALSLS